MLLGSTLNFLKKILTIQKITCKLSMMMNDYSLSIQDAEAGLR